MRKRTVYAGLKQRLGHGSPGAVIGVIALVLALSGGAYAASGALTGKQKKEVKSIAKQFAGQPGAPGATGPAGQGSPGPKGDTGPKGGPGTDGTDGVDGQSPKITFEGPTVCEPSGGVVYEVEGSGEEAEICNGEEGSPWTAGGTLPPGETERGTWSVSGDGSKVPAAISFPIQLAASIENPHILIKGGGLLPPECPGNINHPGAKPGVFCVFLGPSEGASEPHVSAPDGSGEGEEQLVSPPGAIIYWKLLDPEPGEGAQAYATGSYAVTGCDPTPGGPLSCP